MTIPSIGCVTAPMMGDARPGVPTTPGRAGNVNRRGVTAGRDRRLNLPHWRRPGCRPAAALFC